jgi:SEC-C motif-containing protein
MRSRYSAYSINLPDYLMATTHPKNEQYMEDAAAWKHSIQQFTKNTLFKSLEILNASEDGATATVTFRAGLMQGLKDISFTEKSSFEKIDGRWLYLDGVKDED